MKPSMSTRPARLETMLATPQAAAATTVIRKGTGPAAGHARPGDEDEAEAGHDAADDLVRPGPLAHEQAAKRIVKKTCACITTEARLAGMPRLSAANSRPNWATPRKKP